MAGSPKKQVSMAEIKKEVFEEAERDAVLAAAEMEEMGAENG